MTFEASAVTVIRKDGRTYFTFRNETGDEVKPSVPTEAYDEAIQPHVLQAVERSADDLGDVLASVRNSLADAQSTLAHTFGNAAVEVRKALHIKQRRSAKEGAVEVAA
jgi:hypothetical protein